MNLGNVTYIEIPGIPHTKERPRFNGKYAYTPKSTREYEETVRDAYALQDGNNFGDAPLEAILTFTFPIAKSWSKKKRQDAVLGKLPMTKKPDVDNLIKSILDSLNGIAYDDDSQITHITAKKQYGIRPGIILTLKPIIQE